MRYGLDKIFKLKVTTARLNVKLRLHHDITYVYPQPMPYQVSTSYTLGFLSYSPDKLLLPHATYQPTHPETMGVNNIQTALKGCGVKVKHIGANGATPVLIYKTLAENTSSLCQAIGT